MKTYIKSYKEIRKDLVYINDILYIKKFRASAACFNTGMIQFCGRGSFEFSLLTNYHNGEWYTGLGWTWHKSWLNPVLKNKQYFLDFE